MTPLRWPWPLDCANHQPHILTFFQHYFAFIVGDILNTCWRQRLAFIKFQWQKLTSRLDLWAIWNHQISNHQIQITNQQPPNKLSLVEAPLMWRQIGCVSWSQDLLRVLQVGEAARWRTPFWQVLAYRYSSHLESLSLPPRADGPLFPRYWTSSLSVKNLSAVPPCLIIFHALGK